jgi:hypothetical protein
MIFFYPFLLGMALQAFQIPLNLDLGFALIALFFLPQYTFMAYVNRGHGYTESDIAEVSRAISSSARDLGLSPETVRIYGDYGLWFAHPDRYRAAAVSTIPEIQTADLYLCYDVAVEPLHFAPNSMLHCADIKRYVSLQLIRTIPVRGNALNIYRRN